MEHVITLPSTDIKIALISYNIIWQNPNENIINLTHLLNKIDKNVEIVFLPEMFNTGFTMQAKSMSESMEGFTHTWMREQANRKKCVIVGTIIIKENDQYYNRLLWVEPNGKTTSYDKKHLFRMGNENKVYTSGKKPIVVEYKTWKFQLNICYDLRFPAWSRNKDLQYHCLVYLANWPSIRLHTWNTLLQARSIENLAYTIGVNRTGNDPHHTYFESSYLINPKGLPLPLKKENDIHIYNLQYKTLVDFQKQFPAHLDRDTFLFHQY